jgi:hypothetical protein
MVKARGTWLEIVALQLLGARMTARRLIYLIEAFDVSGLDLDVLGRCADRCASDHCSDEGAEDKSDAGLVHDAAPCSHTSARFAEVLRDGRLCDLERARQDAHGCRLDKEKVQKRATGRIAECAP